MFPFVTEWNCVFAARPSFKSVIFIHYTSHDLFELHTSTSLGNPNWGSRSPPVQKSLICKTPFGTVLMQWCSAARQPVANIHVVTSVRWGGGEPITGFLCFFFFGRVRYNAWSQEYLIWRFMALRRLSLYDDYVGYSAPFFCLAKVGLWLRSQQTR